MAEFWYNTAYHSALGCTPFEVLYGQSQRHLGIANLRNCSVPELEQWMKERELLNRLIQQHLLRAQQRMKDQADKNRSERSFQEGEMVYMNCSHMCSLQWLTDATRNCPSDIMVRSRFFRRLDRWLISWICQLLVVYTLSSMFPS
jgi:hypothetical protein